MSRILDLLVERIDAFEAATGETDWSIGMSVARDPRAVRRLREGRATLAMVARIEALMASHGNGLHIPQYTESRGSPKGDP